MRKLLGSVVVAMLVGVLMAMTPAQAARRDEVPPSFSNAWQVGWVLDVAADRAGNVYSIIDDWGGSLVRKYSANGSLLAQWGGGGAGDGQFSQATGIGVDGTGNVYVADSGNDRIQKFSPDGTFLDGWGGAGNLPGAFESPSDVAVDAVGNVYVVDSGNDRIQRFSAHGTFLNQWSVDLAFGFPYYNTIAVDDSGDVLVLGPAGLTRFTPDGAVVSELPLEGGGGIALDPAGHIYVAVSNDHQIRKYAPDGTLLAQWGTFGSGDGQFWLPSGIAADEAGNVYVADSEGRIQRFLDLTVIPAFSHAWGDRGIGDLQFRSLEGVAVDDAGDVYVADTGGNAIKKYRSTGTFARRWGGTGSGDGQFISPHGIAVHGSVVFVADTGNDRIQVFDLNGNFLTKWGTRGTGNYQFRDPMGVAADAAGNVYVTDSSNGRITEFTMSGIYLRQWSMHPVAGTVSEPSGIAVDSVGNLYVVDEISDHVVVFPADGTPQIAWGTYGDSAAHGIADDRFGTLYVTDASQVRRFTPEGILLGHWGTSGTGPGEFVYPGGVAADPDGRVFVADTGNDRVQVFRPRAPSLSPTLAATEAEVQVGDAIHYQLTVANTGDVALTGVNVRAAGAAECSGALPDIAVGATGILDCTHTATVSDVGTYRNAVTVDALETFAVGSNTVEVTVTGRASELRGTVSEAGSGGPLEGTWVVALRAADFTLVGGTATAADGTYALPVDPGTYHLEFIDPAFSHIIEWYDGHPYDDLAGADPVVATAGATTTVDATLQDPTGAITGTATEAGTGGPLAGAVVAVLPAGVPRPLAAARTDAQGRYRIDRLPPGGYLVVAAMPDGTHLAAFHGATTDVNAAVPVSVTAGRDRSGTSVELPAVTGDPVVGDLTGALTDEVTGRAEPGALVAALRVADFRLTAATFAGQDGSYRLGLSSGDHYLETIDLDTGHEFEWYDDQHTPGDWGELTTVSGEQTANRADVALTPLEGDITGTVIETGSGTPLAGIWVALIGYDTGQPVAGVVTGADGAYRVPALDVGRYLAVFIDPTGRHALEYNDDATSMEQVTPVLVTGGRATTVDAALAPHF